MAETEAATGPAYKATIEQVGPCKTRVVIEVPEQAIQAALDEEYRTLRQEVILPGFRRGRAPRPLLEKRLGKEARQEVKLRLINQTADAAIRDNKLAVLNDPQIEVETIELPAKGSMTFQFEVEVWPEFELPELEGIPINKTVRQATGEDIDTYLMELRRVYGTWTPRPQQQACQLEDLVVASVRVTIQDQQPQDLQGVEIRVRPQGTISQIPVHDLDKHLVGKKEGESVDITVEVPKTYFREEYRGKQVQLHVQIQEIKYLRPADMDKAFMARYSAESEQQLREMIRNVVQNRLDRQSREEMEDQIYRFLLENISFDLPVEMVAKQTAAVLKRMYVRLLQKGLSPQQIEEHLEALRASSEEEANRQVKTFFIIDKLCEKLGIEVTEEEVNGIIAQLAYNRGMRPERLKELMTRDGSLGQLELDVRQEKCIDRLLQTAKITEVAPANKTTKKKPSDPSEKKGKRTHESKTKA